MDSATNDHSINLLVIGETGTGKTTFINRLSDLSQPKEKLGKEGDGIKSETGHCKDYNVKIPLGKFFVRDEATYHEVVIGEDEESYLRADAELAEDNSYKLHPRNEKAGTLGIRLIDTPGLNDSSQRDFEHMFGVLTYLGNMPKTRRFHGVILTMKPTGVFGDGFQKKMEQYRTSFPDLFARLIIIYNDFDLAQLTSKRSEYLERKIINESQDVVPILEHERAQALVGILGEDESRPSFSIDNKPQNKPWQLVRSRNCLADILDHISSLDKTGKSIGSLVFFKTEQMQKVDAALRRHLEKAEEDIADEKQTLIQAQAGQQKAAQLRDDLYARILSQSIGIAALEKSISEMDDDNEYTIRTVPIDSRHHTNLAVFGSAVAFSGVKGIHTITEPKYRSFEVRAENSSSGEWISKKYTPGTRSWKGEYKGNFGQRPRLSATSYTTNRLKYSEKIKEHCEQKAIGERQLSDDKQLWAAKGFGEFGKQIALPSDMADLDKLVSETQVVKELMKFLDKEQVPLELGCGKAAINRYKCKPSEIGWKHAAAFAEETRLDLSMIGDAFISLKKRLRAKA